MKSTNTVEERRMEEGKITTVEETVEEDHMDAKQHMDGAMAEDQHAHNPTCAINSMATKLTITPIWSNNLKI